MLPRVVVSVETDCALCRLATRRSLCGPLDAMIDCVSDQVQQRVTNLLDDGLVELRVFSIHGQRDALAQLAGNVMDHALEALEGRPDFRHTQL